MASISIQLEYRSLYLWSYLPVIFKDMDKILRLDDSLWVRGVLVLLLGNGTGNFGFGEFALTKTLLTRTL
jgi:hypothetical protein